MSDCMSLSIIPAIGWLHHEKLCILNIQDISLDIQTSLRTHTSQNSNNLESKHFFWEKFVAELKIFLEFESNRQLHTICNHLSYFEATDS